MTLTIDVLGWVGMVLYIAGYYLVSSGRLHGRSRLFQVLNIAAAVLVALNAGYYRAWPSCAVNAVWFLIAVLTVTGFIRAPESHQGLPKTERT